MTLHQAASEGNLLAMRRLIAEGADVNARDTGPKTVYSPSWTPLHYAAAAGYVDAVRLLLEAGGAVDAQSGNGQTPLQYAAKEGHREVVRVLLEAGADGDMSMCRLLERGMTLHEAARRGDVAAIRALIAHGADVNATIGASIQSPRPGPTPLHYAAAAGHAQVLELLLEAGADPDVEVLDLSLEPAWRTPMVMSAQQGRLDMVKALLKHGARVDPTTAQTAGNWASEEAAAFLRKVWRQRVDARTHEFMQEVKGSYVGNRHDLFERISPILFWFADYGVEALVALLLRKDNTVAAAAVKVGESTRVEYDPRPVFDAAETCGAAKMLFGHNHPNSSSPRPSDEDVLSCVDLWRRCEDRGLELADDLVVCQTSEGRTLRSVTQTTRFRDMTRGY